MTSGADRLPPYRIPGQHFVAAAVFLLLGAGLLCYEAPALAAGAFSDPGLVAATHLLTLGWVGTSIMGALYQILPVALLAPLRWERLADATFVAWVAGIAAFVPGALEGRSALLHGGAGLLGLAIVGFGVQVLAMLARTDRRGVTWWCVGAATLALAGGWVLGALLALNLGSGLLGGSRFVILLLHVHVAAGGWVLLTIIGVSHRLLPMFLIAGRASRLLGTVAAGCVALATALLLLSEHVLPIGVIEPGLWLMAAGAAVFLLQAVVYARHRRVDRVDPGLRLVGGALVLLAAAVAAGVTALAVEGPLPRLLTAYGLLLVPGGLGLFVAGVYYRVIPFLTVLHRFRSTDAADTPAPRELFDHRIAQLAAVALVGGAAAMAGGALWGVTGVCVAGGLLFVAGAVVEVGQLAAVARKRP